jgi:hypothetical protein
MLDPNRFRDSIQGKVARQALFHEQAVEENRFVVICAGKETNVMDLQGTPLEINNYEALSGV